MKPISFWRYISWSQFAKPSNDRIAYRLIKKHKFRSIVEIGLSEGVRCERMIRVSQKYGDPGKIRYTGVDLFEARDAAETPLRLIEMHRKLNSLGAKAQLVPGSFDDAIPRIANAHAKTDLVIVHHPVEDESYEAAWRFLPRMLHVSSQVLVFYNETEYEVFNFAEVEQRVRQLTERGQVARAA